MSGIGYFGDVLVGERLVWAAESGFEVGRDIARQVFVKSPRRI